MLFIMISHELAPTNLEWCPLQTFDGKSKSCVHDIHLLFQLLSYNLTILHMHTGKFSV